MELEERLKLYETAIDLWGIPNQVFMVMEETGEMLNALAKYNRGRSTPKEIITELADVWILMEQMAVVFGYPTFIEEKNRKLLRLKERIEGGISLKVKDGGFV